MTFYPRKPSANQRIQSDVEAERPDIGFIAHLHWDSPDAASLVAVHAAVTLADGETTTVTTGITNPDVPRALQIKGNQAGVTGNVVITGKNINDETITETIVANAANAVQGNKAFKSVSQIVMPARAGAGDTISVGFNDKLGMPYLLSHNTVLAAYLNNAKEGTAPTVTVSASAEDGNTVDLNSALDGNPVDVYLIV